MNIQYLRYAVEVEKAGSISQAAENLFMGQPNLSKAIRELEEHVGASLFVRTRTGVAPTQSGEEFLFHAKNLLAQMDDFESRFERGKTGTKTALRVCAPRASYISYAFTDFINGIGEGAPYAFEYHETGTGNTVNHIQYGESNIGIIRFPAEYMDHFMRWLEEKGMVSEPVWMFESRVIFSKDNALAAMERVGREALRQCVELTHGDIAIPQLSLSQARRMKNEENAKRRVVIYERGSQFDLLRRVPNTYMWVSPMPRGILDQYGLEERPADEPPMWCDMLAYREGYRLKRLEREFMEHVKRVRDELCGKSEA